MKDKPKFVYAILIRTSPEKLWEALTTTEIIQPCWFGCCNTSTWKVGDPVESRSSDGELQWQGTILENEYPRRLSFTFEKLGLEEPPSRVIYEIEPLGTSTNPAEATVKLKVIHDEFIPDSKVLSGISEGWPRILSSLKSLLETGKAIDPGAGCCE